MSKQSKWLWVVGALIVGGVLLDRGVPIQYILVGALVLLCPAMMLFMGKKHMDEDSKGKELGASPRGPESDTERKSK